LTEAASHDMSQYHARHRQNENGEMQGWSPRPLEAISELYYRGERADWSAIIQHDSSWLWVSSDREEVPWIDSAAMCLSWEPSTPVDAMLPTGLVADAENEIHLFSAVPILDPADQRVQAYYVVGRRFNDRFVEDLERRTRVSFQISPPTSDPPDHADIQWSGEGNTVSIETPLIDSNGVPISSLLVWHPKEVSRRSEYVTAIARYFSLCGILVAILTMLLFLQRTVIGRLDVIRKHTERIAASGILTESNEQPIFVDKVPDEIGQLAGSFDRMRLRLSKAQRRLVDSSHSAGMSLVADTVIHNVGNVLTNVNSLIETATGRVDRLRVQPLDRLAEKLQQTDPTE
ncbi:MAG: HAMP domain-containing protein, partial [Planctomycetota bacterium]